MCGVVHAARRPHRWEGGKASAQRRPAWAPRGTICAQFVCRPWSAHKCGSQGRPSGGRHHGPAVLAAGARRRGNVAGLAAAGGPVCLAMQRVAVNAGGCADGGGRGGWVVPSLCSTRMACRAGCALLARWRGRVSFFPQRPQGTQLFLPAVETLARLGPFAPRRHTLS